jgi:uronate dehydrogenase
MTLNPDFRHPGTVLLTGAAGVLGRQLAAALSPACGHLVLSDLPAAMAAWSDAPAGATLRPADLADAGAVLEAVQGVDAIVHFGAVPVEGPFGPILEANIRGTHHIYEAARRHGVRRVVFASSNHVTGGYRREDRITPQDPPRPDGNYGASKLYGEGLARLYWDRYGIESVCLRIGTATPTPPDRRGLSGWLSPRDLVQLVGRALTAPDVGCLIAFGCSDNLRSWWDSAEAWQRLGYVPQDRSEDFAAQVAHLELPPGPQTERQGGSFLAIGPFDDPPATR